MQLQQSFEVPSSAERVWRSFSEIAGVVDCLPGASLLAPPDNGRLQLAMSVKLGPIGAKFVGDGELALDDATRSGSVSGQASDRKSGSRIKGRIAFALSEAPAAAAGPMTHVALTIDYAIGGALAQFSREGIVRDLAQRLTESFANNLRRKLEAPETLDAVTTHGSQVQPETSSIEAAGDLDPRPPIADTADTAVTANRVARFAPAASFTPAALATAHASLLRGGPAASPAPLNFGALLWAALLDRIKALFRRGRH